MFHVTRQPCGNLRFNGPDPRFVVPEDLKLTTRGEPLSVEKVEKKPRASFLATSEDISFVNHGNV